MPCDRIIGRQQIALLPLAQLVDLGIVGRPFDAVIPRMVVGMAVAVVFAVRLVVLVVVGDEVVEVEAVMRGDEIDAGPRLAAALVEEVAETGDALGEVRQAGPRSPFQKLRTVSRNLSFHSAQPGGNRPT